MPNGDTGVTVLGADDPDGAGEMAVVLEVPSSDKKTDVKVSVNVER